MNLTTRQRLKTNIFTIGYSQFLKEAMEENEEVGGANLFVQTLIKEKIDAKTDYHPDEIFIEDNVGESIHIHIRNLRFEFTIKDFLHLADEMQCAKEALKNGDR